MDDGKIDDIHNDEVNRSECELDVDICRHTLMVSITEEEFTTTEVGLLIRTQA